MHSRGFFNVIDDEDEESAFPQLRIGNPHTGAAAGESLCCPRWIWDFVEGVAPLGLAGGIVLLVWYAPGKLWVAAMVLMGLLGALLGIRQNSRTNQQLTELQTDLRSGPRTSAARGFAQHLVSWQHCWRDPHTPCIRTYGHTSIYTSTLRTDVIFA